MMDNPRLSPVKRREEILKLLKTENIIEVIDLMNIFQASRATITRDLSILEEKELVKKTYGAIINNQPVTIEKPYYSFDISLTEQVREKRAIAVLAASLITANTSVVFNSGVTTFEVAKLIAKTNRRVNIVTNSLEIAKLFSADVLRNVLLLGGDLAPGGHKVTGTLACVNMENMQGNLAFLGVHDIDPDAGITNPFSAEAELISVIIKRSRKNVLLADHTKFGRVSLYKSDCKFEDIDMIITDSNIDEKYIEIYEELGIEILVADV
jgi:DeoR/GlpR family transcriptional regulator of sugar metabolism